jgi:hypothetical protein
VPIYGEMGKKCSDFLLAHIDGVTFAMKENKAADPVGVSLFGADAIMFDAQMPAHPIKQLWRRRGCRSGGNERLHARG